MALYGCEAAQINNSVFQQLRASIANVIGPMSAKSSIDLVFEFSSTSLDLDPEAYVLYQRASSLGRIMAKYNGFQNTVSNILVEYISHPEKLPQAQGPVGMLL